MHWFEIIHLRAYASKDKTAAISAISHIKQIPIEGVSAEIKLLEDFLLSTDLRVIIKWQRGEKAPGKSAAGLHIASALSTFGMIHHTVWVSVKPYA